MTGIWIVDAILVGGVIWFTIGLTLFFAKFTHEVKKEMRRK